ncbi:MAG: HEPN domain-containing protein [Terriglobia bacterium]|jgi:uncharacterized protein (UPF0332 family)
MNEHVQAYLRKAQERLKDAEGMFSLSRYAGTVNRTYYAMFEAAAAMLASLGLVFESHQGVISKFGELLAKTGRVEPRFGHNLKEAFGLREDADYALDARAEIPRHTAEAELRKAREFVTMAENFLKAGGEFERS